MTDQQRPLFSSQAALLAENHPENIEFRATERNGRHLTSSMWYRTLPNCERVKRSWLIYSKTKNAILCACCKIYQKPSSAAISALCSTGFINWKKTSEILTEHEATQMHKECMIKWKTRLQQMKSCQGIDQDIERVVHTEKEKWRQILRIVMDAVLYLSTNCLSFRGSHETPSDLITQCPQPSQGNFLNLISLLAKHNSTLNFQLEHLKKGQVSYLSKTTQNEIIDIMAKTVRNNILNDIKEAKYYTIMFDCTPDVSHTEQMRQVIRYVKKTDDVCEIKESLIDFIEVAGKTGEVICQQILEKLTVDDLDIGQCRGQSYDNGSNMAGIYKGVQARIAERNELAEFVPCLAHSLNLVGVHSASSCQEAINLFGLIQKVYSFFVGSTTRWDIMKKYPKTNLKGSSHTRWSAKHVAVNALLNNLPDVAEALEEVKQTSHAPEAKYEAGHLLTAIKNFNFILNLTIWANILREINRVNNENQKKDIILARSVALMDGLLKTLQKMRQNPMEHWIKEAGEIAEKTGVEPILENKRIPKRKKHFDEMPLLEKIRENCNKTEDEELYSIDEMMILYKGTKAGNLRQYMPKKPKKWGFKMFVRAGVSGIVYDFLMYAGSTTFNNVTFSEQEEGLGSSGKVVAHLCKTIPHPETSIVYFDNWFCSLELITLLKNSYNINSLGTIRSNRLRNCTLENDKSLLQKGRGSYDYMNDNNIGIAVVRWADTKCVTLASSFVSYSPVVSVKRYSKEEKKKLMLIALRL
nr:unnamed protein product [Callosobruchus chinensis]